MPNKTKEEIIESYHKSKEYNKLVETADNARVIVREILFPILQEDNGDVKQAKSLSFTTAHSIMQSFDKLKSTMKVGDLDCLSMYNREDPRFPIYEKLFSLLADKPVNLVLMATQALPEAIEKYYSAELEKKKITEIDLDAILN